MGEKQILKNYYDIEEAIISVIAVRLNRDIEKGMSKEAFASMFTDIESLNKDIAEIIAEKSDSTKEEVFKMMHSVSEGIIDITAVNEAYKAGLSRMKAEDLINSYSFKSIVNKAYEAQLNDLKIINTRVLQSSSKAYMNIITSAFVEVSQGIYDYRTAIIKNTQRFAEQGITAATYLRQGKPVNYSLESVLMRDMRTAQIQLANGLSEEAAYDLDAEYVEINSFPDCRPEHASWQGKVIKKDELEEITGYGSVTGLGGVNCRHRFFPFFPEYSVPISKQYDERKVKKNYAISQQQRALERKVRSAKRQAVTAYDLEDKQSFNKAAVNLNKARTDLKDFAKANNLKELDYRITVGGFDRNVSNKAKSAGK